VTSLAKLYDRLERHDWYYQMSDDHRCWQRGEADWKEITEMAASIPGGDELKGAFSTHYYTGEPWGNEKQPKPERPHDGPTCYQCEQPVNYLFDDGRCKDCTRLIPDEVLGNV